MLTETERAASQIAGTDKCRGCKKSEQNWRGVYICKQHMSPKRCGQHYYPKKSIQIRLAEGLFK